MTEAAQRPVLGVIRRLGSVNGENPPCKKAVQKIVYLIEEAGEDLGYDYGIHFYGPYSAELDYELQDLNARGILGIDYTPYGHLLSAPEASGNIKLGKTAERILRSYGAESPSRLELLATALFVERGIRAKDKKGIIAGVKKIKGSKYSDEQIENAVLNLQQNGFFKLEQASE